MTPRPQNTKYEVRFYFILTCFRFTVHVTYRTLSLLDVSCLVIITNKIPPNNPPEFKINFKNLFSPPSGLLGKLRTEDVNSTNFLHLI